MKPFKYIHCISLNKRVHVLLMLFPATFSFAQHGIGTNRPNPNTALDISSTDKGILIPRVILTDSTVFLDGISATSSDVSILVYNTNDITTNGLFGAGHYFWDGTKWTTILNSNNTSVPSCPSANTTLIQNVPATACAGSMVQLSVSDTNLDNYIWSANNEAFFDDNTSAEPLLMLPLLSPGDPDLTVKVTLMVSLYSCGVEGTVNLTPVEIIVKAPPAGIAISGPSCLDIEVTDSGIDPLNFRTQNVDDFTNRIFTVENPPAGSTFSWKWVQNPGNVAVINGSTTGQNVDTTFEKTFNGLGDFTLECTITGTNLPCGSLTLRHTVSVKDASCFCDTAVVEVKSPYTGRIWMDRNLGATRAAVSGTDHLSYGCLFQWGRINDGHGEINWTSGTTGTPVFNDITSQGIPRTLSDFPGHPYFIDYANWSGNPELWNPVVKTRSDPCPSGFRVPTLGEIISEYNEFQDAGLSTFDAFLKVPYAGIRDGNSAALLYTGERSYIWGSSDVGSYVRYIFVYPSFPAQNDTYYNRQNSNNGLGYSVRCIKQLSND